MSRRATVRGRPWRVRGGSSHGAKSAHSASLRSVGYAFCLAMPPGYTRPQPLFQTRSEMIANPSQTIEASETFTRGLARLGEPLRRSAERTLRKLSSDHSYPGLRVEKLE